MERTWKSGPSVLPEMSQMPPIEENEEYQVAKDSFWMIGGTLTPSQVRNVLGLPDDDGPDDGEADAPVIVEG